MAIRTPDSRELKLAVNLAVINMPGRSEFNGYYAPMSMNIDPQNIKSAQYYENNNYPQIKIEGTDTVLNKITPKLNFINSLQNAHINPVNNNPSASSCTFAFGGLEPDKVHPIYGLLKGPSKRDTITYNPTFTGDITVTSYDPGTLGATNRIGSPIIPFNKFYKFATEPPVLVTYNIWNIYNNNQYFSGNCTKYQGPDSTNGDPSIRTISDPVNGSSISVSALGVGKSITARRIFPVSMDAVYRKDPKVSNAKLFIPNFDGSNYVAKEIRAEESSNSGFTIKILSADLASNDSEILISFQDETSVRSINKINGYYISLKPNSKPSIIYRYKTDKEELTKLLTQLEAPIFNVTDKQSYDIYIHFVGPNCLIGFSNDITKWNSIYPQEISPDTVAENYLPKDNSFVEIKVSNGNVKFQYSAIIFDNYNPENYQQNDLEDSFKSSIIVDFKAPVKPVDKTDAITPKAIFDSFIDNRYLGSIAPISKVDKGKISVYGDWRMSSGLGQTVEFKYKEVQSVTKEAYKINYGILIYDTTIEGPAFMNIENKKSSKVDSGLITPIPRGDLTPWVSDIRVSVSSSLQNSSYVSKTCEITLKNLDTTEHGFNILQLIEHNVCVVQVWAGYDLPLYPYFQGFINNIDGNRTGSQSSITISCEDVGTYCLKNIYFDMPMLFGNVKIDAALKSVIDFSGFSDYFVADYTGIDGADLRLNPNPSANQDQLRALPTDTIQEKLFPMLEKMNTLGKQPVFRWDESNGVFKLESRYKNIDTDLKFIGITNFGTDSANPNGQLISVNPDTSQSTPDWHGLLTGSFSVNTTIENLAYGVKTFGQTYNGFEYQESGESFLADAMSDAAFDRITRSLETGNIPEGYVGFRKYVIDALNSNELPSRQLVLQKHAINELIVRKPYHSISFNCYVTKPLTAHGVFVLEAFIDGTVDITDQYMYESVTYTFDKTSNLITAAVNGISQPWTIKELDMKN